MLNKIILFSIKNKLAIGIFTTALIVWGIYSLIQLPIDALPDITNNQVQIITKAPTLASQEVEQFITYPVERSLSNLPDIVEMRSMSRFGLSVITVVFKENVNIYFARQLIGEKLREAQEKIPAQLGRPELAPITTGLGEIYQYTIHPKKGSEAKYSAMDLRTMQDWIVSRQLYGIPGVAEVSGFGGISKQYEVSIDPNRLKAMNVTIPEIFMALEKNNENTGGAYIEKKPNAYFIRGIGLMRNVSDVENTLIKKQANSIPLYIKDVASVGLGSPPRYGAMTYNGEKEVVGGIVLMLKGANSADVVNRVKERMATVQQSLPNDVVIEPFLDRTNLIDRAISTVKKNLIEGALIVIFVLVIFLGNLRAGLIVASAIPLSLLFALGMMNLFGVSANLMSLGAIDFGLIVDGAVIIVEAVMHHLEVQHRTSALSQVEMDEEVYQSSSKIRSSAAFGEIIILIVYIPILTLIGIEGKMFRPMAETVSFAIIGALILSLTYIPMMSALFLSKKPLTKKSFSDLMMAKLHKLYSPMLEFAIKQRTIIVVVSVSLLLLSGFVFSRLGGEFIPQLEEGDYAIEFVLPQSASLSQTIETVMQAERLIRQFPEVKTVVGKTGSADVATDPMPPNASDLMVILKDKDTWTKGRSFYGLADEIRAKLENIPGVIAEPSQPIQMRFNELMTGIKQDVAVKIFGENMDSLGLLAEKVAANIRGIKGVTLPQVERINGLPQISIEYDRARLANYGIDIADVNKVVSTAFAGYVAGAIYENERKFDLTVKLDSAYRTTIEDVSNLNIPINNGVQIPLSQIAKVTYQTGPAQISRENGRRRIVISFNVNGRDVQSTVEDVQATLQSKVKLPVGYYYTYGGAFENLQRASDRLKIAVPIALVLIYVLLYLTFRSFRNATLIFTAIPMSAIGGVFALLIRGMPFSISAGVGFIALFGVAVLNGIVLIGTFNQLAKESGQDILQRVREGTRIRLRPVLMTATVASLGFLPMALSTGAGAEVQKPLATVVIGGLLSATLLTLFVLPLLYIIFSKPKKISSGIVGATLIMLCCIIPTQNYAQTTNNRISFNEAFDLALKNNLQLKSNEIALVRSQTLSGTFFSIPKTGLFAENEDLRPSDNKGILKIGVSQSVEWPGVYTARRNLLQQQVRSLTYTQQLRVIELRRNLSTAYYNLWYQQSKQQLWLQLDSFYQESARIARLRVRTGESAGLDSIAASAKSMEVRIQLQTIQNDILIQQTALKALINTDVIYLPENGNVQKITAEYVSNADEHPFLLVQQQAVNVAQADLRITRLNTMPDFSGRFFSQRLYNLPNPYSGFSVSVNVPLLGLGSYRSKVKAANLERDYQQTLYNYESQQFDAQLKQTIQALEKNKQMLLYYETTGLAQAEQISKAASLAYKGGEISFAELSQYLNQATDIRKNYLEALQQYNQNAIQLNYYQNK
ncbi:MAG: CusA/CzcA family heavy metal efflux RND transporter [Bacteroidetes bacterium]|nr:CusA/CzcA family heavy metal efflux RND transporter [Bacteroidota bacterium]